MLNFSEIYLTDRQLDFLGFISTESCLYFDEPSPLASECLDLKLITESLVDRVIDGKLVRQRRYNITNRGLAFLRYAKRRKYLENAPIVISVTALFVSVIALVVSILG